jgi:hypothetical protein
MAAHMAQTNGIGGVGIWALGMDGSNDQAMVSALDGNAPAQKDALAGPSSTSSSASPTQPTGSSATAPSTTGSTTSTSGAAPTTTTTSTTLPAFIYQGQWEGNQVDLTPGRTAKGLQTLLGPLAAFNTSNPKYECLSSEAVLDVYAINGDPSHDYVIARRAAGDCMDAVFLFAATTAPPATTTTIASTTSSS